MNKTKKSITIFQFQVLQTGVFPALTVDVAGSKYKMSLILPGGDNIFKDVQLSC